MGRPLTESWCVLQVVKLLLDSSMTPRGGWPEVGQGKVEPRGVEQLRELTRLWMATRPFRRELLWHKQCTEDQATSTKVVS